jgi:hypothetical protein
MIGPKINLKISLFSEKFGSKLWKKNVSKTPKAIDAKSKISFKFKRGKRGSKSPDVIKLKRHIKKKR